MFNPNNIPPIQQITALGSTNLGSTNPNPLNALEQKFVEEAALTHAFESLKSGFQSIDPSKRAVIFHQWKELMDLTLHNLSEREIRPEDRTEDILASMQTGITDFMEKKHQTHMEQVAQLGMTPVEREILKMEMQEKFEEVKQEACVVAKTTLEKITADFARVSDQLALIIAVAKAKGCHPSEISFEEARDYRSLSLAESLIQEEEEEKKQLVNQKQLTSSSQKAGAGKRKRKGNTQKVARNANILKKKVAEKSSQKSIVSSAPSPSPHPVSSSENLRFRMASKLSWFQVAFNEHRRVTERWKTHDCATIRQFVDKDSEGIAIMRYESLSDQEIAHQRACHYLPGTEKILFSPLSKDIYPFPTQTGFGLLAQLVLGGKSFEGVIYFGFASNSMLIHRHFEEMNFKEETRSLFVDSLQGKTAASDTLEALKGWKSFSSFHLEFDEKGVIQVTYPEENHYVRIFPITKNLLNKRAFFV